LSSSSTSGASVSAVVVSHNEGDHLRRTVHRLLATLPSDGELVVVDDASTDGSADDLAETHPTVRILRPTERLGVAAARNFGAQRTSGRMIVFSDAHVDPPLGWCEAFAPLLDQRDVGAVGPAATAMGGGAGCGYGRTWTDSALTSGWLPRRGTEPYPVPMLCGFFVALRREVFEAAGGFDDGLVGWGGEDVELSVRLWTAGYRCVVVPTIRVAHLFRTRFPYDLAADAPTHNLLRIAAVHLSPARLAKVVAHLRARPAFPEALARFVAGDGARRRETVRAQRRFDDDWFCRTFDIDAFDRNGRESAQ
jgi:glycosyltransferase involved in cell wall biosynthesis